MQIISDPIELKNYLKEQNATIGFVPTMGALHDGHISLIKRAREENEVVVVSIFVNPTQFLAGEDLEKYPRKDEADKKICELSGVDILFFPTKESIYSEDEVALVAPNVRGYTLEGLSRPGHFNGVLTVVMKLLNIVSPTRAYFGKKDAQQLNLITLMVKQLFMSVEIVPVDTLRESDGLALSSRNIYLSAEQRKEALKISSSLRLASSMISNGQRDVKVVKSAMQEHLKGIEIAYIELLSREFEYRDEIVLKDTIILVEVVIGSTRLLDNIWL